MGADNQTDWWQTRALKGQGFEGVRQHAEVDVSFDGEPVMVLKDSSEMLPEPTAGPPAACEGIWDW